MIELWQEIDAKASFAEAMREIGRRAADEPALTRTGYFGPRPCRCARCSAKIGAAALMIGLSLAGCNDAKLNRLVRAAMSLGYQCGQIDARQEDIRKALPAMVFPPSPFCDEARSAAKEK